MTSPGRSSPLPLLVLAFTALSLGSTGCASASIHSKREPGELPPLSRLFIAGSPQNAEASEERVRLAELSSTVTTLLSGRGIAASAHVFDPMEMSNPQALRQRIAESQADGMLLLTLSMAEAWVASGGMGGVASERTTTTRVEALLTPAGSDRRMWSATCQFGRTSEPSQAILDSCAQKLVEQLFQDGVLTPTK
jgi:hypothetical protein